MSALARFAHERRKLVLVIWVVMLIGFNVLAGVAKSNYKDSFSLKGTDSARAYALLTAGSKGVQGDTNQIVVEALHGTLNTPATAARVEALTRAVAALPGVAAAVSPLSPFAVHQLSPSGTIGIIDLTFTKNGFTMPRTQIQKVETVGASYRSSTLNVQFGGHTFAQLNRPAGSPGELFGFVAAGVVLLLAFGSFFGMLTPLVVAIFGLGTASAFEKLLSHAFTIASFAPTLGSLIGIGVGIDYALFIVTRHRQSLKHGESTLDAVVTAINTSGRAVLFAGGTVCIALLGMLTLGMSFLNGVAISASVTVLTTVIASVTLLPALLGIIGPRILSRRERRALATQGPIDEAASGVWQRWAEFVRRHPVSLSSAALVLMALLVIPTFSLQLGNADAGSDPASTTTRQAYDILSKGFGPGSNGPLLVVGFTGFEALQVKFDHLNADVRALPGVAVASEPIYRLGTNKIPTISFFTVVQKYSPQDVRTSRLIVTIRDMIKKAGLSDWFHVGGTTAIFDDFASTLGGKLPLFIGVIVLLGCLLLMIAFRSVLVPLMAAVMNLLAAGASFGVVVAIFQWGWGGSLFNLGKGPVESFLPVIMIAILFGLSMDYQVFLVSRMHEEWTHGKSNADAVTRGQSTTGRVITAAAVIMICVFLSFVFGGERVIAEFGIGLGGAVLLDAFVLRTVLVPAVMHLLGARNWWMPKWLDRVVPHLAVEAPDA